MHCVGSKSVPATLRQSCTTFLTYNQLHELNHPVNAKAVPTLWKGQPADAEDHLLAALVRLGGARRWVGITELAHDLKTALPAFDSRAYSTPVTGLDIVGGRVASVFTDRNEHISADAVVVALGSYSAGFLRPYEIDLPIYPVKGYSLTIPILDPSKAPISTVMDESYKIAITRLGDRVRVGGTAEISGYTSRLDARRRKTLEHSVSDLFPGSDLANATFWTGLRPMTPDGTPVIGSTRIPGLFLNTGHGTLGWTMSSGSARVISDLVSARTPEIDVADLGVARYA